jgi:hypothetical protein
VAIRFAALLRTKLGEALEIIVGVTGQVIQLVAVAARQN